MANGSQQALARRYELISKRMEQDEAKQKQKEQEALQRRFATMGATGSGAAVRAEQETEQESARRLSSSRMGLEATRLQEEQRMQEIQEQRQYQTGEREASQKFASGEAATQREWASGESASQRDWAAEQADLNRIFSREEREFGQAFTREEREFAQAFTREEREFAQEFATNERLDSQAFMAAENFFAREIQKQQLELDRLIAQFNMGIAEETLAESKIGLPEKLDPTGSVRAGRETLERWGWR